MNRQTNITVNRYLPKAIILLILLFLIVGIRDLHCQDIGKKYYFFFSETLQNKINLYTKDLPDTERWIYQESIIVDDEKYVPYTEISETPYPVKTAMYNDNKCMGYGTIEGVKKWALYGSYYYYSHDFITINK